jgi:hypothetical protein
MTVNYGSNSKYAEDLLVMEIESRLLSRDVSLKSIQSKPYQKF